MYKFKQLKTLLLLVCSMLILYGCSGSGSSSPSSLPVIEMTSLNLTTGGSGFLTATLPSAPSSAVTVNFSFVDSQNIVSSDAAQSCTIAAGATSCAIGVTAGNTGGTANAIASASGYQGATAIIIVASSPVIEMTSLNLTTGGSGFLTAALPSAPSSAVTVNFNFADTHNVLLSNAAQSCTIAAGATSCAIGVTAGSVTGTAIATATASGYQEATDIITVAALPVIEMTDLNLTTGGSGFLTATLPSEASSAVTVNFAFQDPNSVLSIDAIQSCTVAAGSTSCAIGVTGNKAGAAFVSTYANGYQEATAIITVAALPVIEMTDLNLTTKGNGFLTAILPSAPSSAVTVNFAFTDPKGLLKPEDVESCTIAAGATSCAFGITAGPVSGIAHASAYASGYQEATAIITVAPSPVIEMTDLNLTIGGSGFLTAILPSAPSSAVTINFSFYDPRKVLASSATKSCTVAAGATSCAIGVTASSLTGTATATADAVGYQEVTEFITVAASPVIEMTDLNLITGGTGFLTATLPSAPSSAVTVTFTFVDPLGVLNNSEVKTCTVAAGTTACNVSVTASSEDGDAGVGAVASGYQGATATIRVASQPVIKMANLNLTTGGSGTLTAVLPSAPSSAVTVTFIFVDSSKNVLASTATQSCIVAAGATSCTVGVTGNKVGQALAIAEAIGYQSSSTLISVVALPVIQMTSYLSLTTGDSETLNVTLASAPSSPVIVEFIFLDPDLILASDDVLDCTVFAGTTTCNVTVTASLETGVANVTAEASGYEGNEGIIAVHS